MKKSLFVAIAGCIVLSVCELWACKSKVTVDNVRYISMIPQYIAPPKISEYETQIKEEAAKKCTDFKELTCYINTNKRGSLDITDIRTINTKEETVAQNNSYPMDTLIKLLKIFSNESFANKELFKKNMKLVVLLNRYRSLSECINNSFQTSLSLPNDVFNENIIVIYGLWNPAWKLGGKFVKFEAMQDYFQKFLCKHKDDGKGIKLLKKLEEENPDYNPKNKIGKDNRPALQQNMRPSIPFREIREALLEYVYKQGIIENFTGKPDTSFIYLAIHDSDIVHLNNLYDHYFEILNKNDFPVLASTGYQTARENHLNGKDIISQTASANACNKPISYDDLHKNIDLDMQTRAALSLSDPRLLYWPEPNMIIRVYDTQRADIKKYTFIERKKYKDPHESSILLRSIYEQNMQKVTAVFSTSHPVELKLNESFLSSKKALSSLPQAHYVFRNTAIIAYRQLGLTESKNQFISTFSNLYSLFSKTTLLGVSPQDIEGIRMQPFYSGINHTFCIKPEINFQASVMAIGKIPYGTATIDETEESDDERSSEKSISAGEQ